MKRIVVLTSSELRHTFFRKYLALQNGVEVVASFCESGEKNLANKITNSESEKLRHQHLQARSQVEKDFFELFCTYAKDESNPISIAKGTINDPVTVEKIITLNPDVIVSYGSSIIKPALIDAFRDRFINIHLGLSPYYRGSGTNFWPFVNNAPEFCGVTFMKIDAGIDTGEVLHQIRPKVFATDSFHVICNRLLIDMTSEMALLLQKFDELTPATQLEKSEKDLYYKNSDFTESSVQQLYNNFESVMLEDYIANKTTRDKAVPIIENAALAHD